jgi:micrococcal nuclease
MIEWKDTIPFIPPIKGGNVIKVYDGDTITIASKIPIENSPMYRFSVRLNGVDTPEIKGSTEEEKLCAKEIQKRISELILHKDIQLKNMGNEKWGRILADVYMDNIHINKLLIDERLAVTYDGGTKNLPVSWKRYKENGNML